MVYVNLAERLRRLGVRWERSEDNEGRQQLQRRLDELELRFGEYDHRVKNNTQMVLSILASAAHSTSSVEVHSVLNTVTRKLQAIMHVQTILQRAGYVRTLRCDEFIRELAQGIRDASPRKLVLMLECEPIDLPSSVAVPLGLILNELLTNAIKYAIGPTHGRVNVSLKALGDSIELRVIDNGPGIDANEIATRSSGLAMVQHLAAQLHGHFHTHNGPGGQCVLRFRKPSLEH